MGCTSSSTRSENRRSLAKRSTDLMSSSNALLDSVQMEEASSEDEEQLQVREELSEQAFNRLLDQVAAARESFYSRLESDCGYTLLDLILTKLVNPFFFGGPKWPDLRQSHRCLIHPSRQTAFLISDGLSDPFPPEDLHGEQLPSDFENTGFGFELFAEFKVRDVEESFHETRWIHQWEAVLVDAVSQQLAARGRSVLQIMDKFGGALSTEVPLSQLSGSVPTSIVNRKRSIGVLLFFSRDPTIPKQVVLPTGTVVLIAMRVISEQNLDLILQQETEEETRQARLDLVAQFEEDQTYHLSDLTNM